MAVSELLVFFFLGAIIVLGYIGTRVFERTKVSDVLLLMILGVLIGPVFNLLSGGTVAFMKTITPVVAALALVILLFEGGLHLNFYQTLRGLPKATLFTALVFVITLALTAGILMLLGWPLLTGLLLGAVIGGISSAIVIPVVNRTTASQPTKTLLGLESASTDALCVVVAITIAGIITAGAVDLSVVGQSILGSFSTAAVLGFVVGLGWLYALRHFEGKKYEYLVTIAVLLLLYVFTEFVRGNGAIAALVFGLVLGNAKEVTAMLRVKVKTINPEIKSFQAELSFFIRTFFFVYLGIIFELSALTPTLIGIAVALILVILVARYAGAILLAKLDPAFANDKTLITTMMARGLAAAVLASLPLATGLDIGIHAQEIFLLAFVIILFSNVVTTAGVFVSERKQGKDGNRMKKPPKTDKLQEISVHANPAHPVS